MKAGPTPTTLAQPNPFPHMRNEPYGAYFASIHSHVVSLTRWVDPRKTHFWLLDVASDHPIRLRLNGREVVRPPHSVALYAPNVIREEFLGKGELRHTAWLMFRVAHRRSPLWKLVRPEGYRFFEDPGTLVRPLIGQITACFLQATPDTDYFAQGTFYQILSLLRSARGKPLRRIHPADRPLLRKEGSLREQVENHLRTQPQERVTVAEMARRLGLGLSSFAHRYHEEAGETFAQTKTRLRIAEAKSLLLRGEMSIKQVALELNFFDAAHFSHVFRRVVGTSPAHFAKELAPSFSDQLPQASRLKTKD